MTDTSRFALSLPHAGQRTGLPANRPGISSPEPDAALRKAAQALEAGFLAEMLKSASFGTPRDAFGGGVGEEQFASFLRQAQAEAMVKSGGLGLAESLFQALVKGRSDAK